MASSHHLASPRAVPDARTGIGLRAPHYREVLETRPEVGWFEAHAENYMGGGPALSGLEAIRRDYPVALHGVGTSLGAADGPDPAHLERLADLVERIEPALVSEHLSWSAAGGVYLNDLLPLPYTEETLALFCRNIDHVQNALRRTILVENPSSYLEFPSSGIPEWQFLTEIAVRTGCGLLVDVNNVYVSAHNLGWNASDYIDAIPPAAVGEIHLAGHAVNAVGNGETVLIDDHGAPVPESVWALYGQAVERFGPVPSLIEWDTNIPELSTLMTEAAKADAVRAAHLGGDRDARVA
ncbi:MAG: DUF692 domain-containing protein [Proteobacteria bacterium]|nr:DUF692 domain-containing protein [Pseudomonadota bacterium]